MNRDGFTLVEVIVAALLLVVGVAASSMALAHAVRLQGDAALEMRVTETAITRAARVPRVCVGASDNAGAPPPWFSVKQALFREAGTTGSRFVIVTLGTAWICSR